MPVDQSIHDYITRHLMPSSTLADFETQLEVVVTDIATLLRVRPVDARHTSAWLAYYLSLHYMRSANEATQCTYAELLESLFRRLYNDPNLIAHLQAALPRDSYPVLLNFYHLHHALLMNGLRSPLGPQALDSGDALRMLQIAIGSAHGPWLAHIRLQGGIRDYYHGRVLDDAQGTRIEIGRLPVANAQPLAVVTWNMQGVSEATDTKWRTFVLPLARDHAVVALQEAGIRPASAQHVGNLSIEDQFGHTFLVEHYLWDAGSTSRPERYQLFYLDVQRLRVNLALVVSEAAGVDVVRPVIISDGLPTAFGAPLYRPALGIQIRRSSTTEETITLYTFHAISNGGVNAPRMLREISWHTPTRFVVLGDFNRDPRPGQSDANVRRGNWISPPDIAQLALPDSSTHPGTAPQNMLDYAVVNGTDAPVGQVSTPGPSDHLAAGYRFCVPG